MRLNKDLISIYSAGKTWAGHGFRDMREQGFNINARWIDVQDLLSGPSDSFAPEIHANEAYKREIWDNGCKVDCLACDMMLLYCSPEDGNTHSGSLVELGHVTALGKPVYIIGTCESVEPVGNSDRAWKSQKIVTHWPEITDMLTGFRKAVRHYQRNYRAQWEANHGIA
tara:strand:+ start:4361 stop:4867 length:507 start_codon:yes stop_codon:yes gene_type:complete